MIIMEKYYKELLILYKYYYKTFDYQSIILKNFINIILKSFKIFIKIKYNQIIYLIYT